MVTKSPRQSAVEMTELVMPQHTNPMGSVFGGVVLSWMDIAASICASRHSGMVAITASIDAMSFLAPIKLGSIVIIKACMNYVAKTSCEIGVEVSSENLTGTRTHTASALVTMVTLGPDGKPAPMPGLHPETQEEKMRFEGAVQRRALRLSAKRH